MSAPHSAPTPPALPSVAREVEDFVSAAGWDQAPQLFALVSTADLLAKQPDLAAQLDPSAALTPIAQEPLPTDDLVEALAGIAWPDEVTGCALAQEIVVLPPEAEAELADEEDAERAKQFAAQHPRRREARLVAAVLRDGSAACVLRLRGDQEHPDEIVEHPELAPNLTDALRETLRP
ncbi:PPA1309 family protein [Goodfellowiella coeruleoviolacea]|uniref:Uncharacterized protein n=1 Tax=Goodfellowiella coeruleoviolacea TaxID=334858 RepID=A0AAE3GIA0_9PSEU|nr:PPA1309 family protein [Goodfellowiella coeruleoviolacea]MCP2167904.1 hypothetical protein [Goodfellowiella coeruleoviolacea]